MQHSLIKKDGHSETVELSDSIFDCKFNEPLVHQVICAYGANMRQGTHAQKTRAEVSGGGRKPFRQKGLGRARAGSIRSPIWRGGGATFAVKPRDYSQKINKKMYRQAMRSIFSTLVQEDRLVIATEITISEPKTNLLVQQLKTWGTPNVMIILTQVDEMLHLAARNLPHVKLCFIKSINPIDLIRYPKTLISVSALKQLEESLS